MLLERQQLEIFIDFDSSGYELSVLAYRDKLRADAPRPPLDLKRAKGDNTGDATP